MKGLTANRTNSRLFQQIAAGSAICLLAIAGLLIAFYLPRKERKPPSVLAQPAAAPVSQDVGQSPVTKKKPIVKIPDTSPSNERKGVCRMLATPFTIPSLLLRHEKDKWTRINPDQTINSTEFLLTMPGSRSKLLVGGVEVRP